MAISFLLVALVGFVDHTTGPELSFSIFCLVPIAVVSWFGGRSVGSLVAFTTAIVWLFADLTSGHNYSNQLIPLRDAGVRLGSFTITGQLVSLVKLSLERQQDLARIDALIKVLNGRAFHEEGERLLALSRRRGGPFSLAYIDLDNFQGR
jgi:predicted signal transduction protein with EAL and GGDEF domain